MSYDRVSLADRLRIGADYLDGFTLKDIRHRYGLRADETICRIARRLGIPSRRIKAALVLTPPRGRPRTAQEDAALLAAELADDHDMEFEPYPIGGESGEPLAPPTPQPRKNRLTGNRVTHIRRTA